MKEFPFLSSACVYIEIGQHSLQALHGDHGLELPLERLENGRLTGPCKERLTLTLQGFLKPTSWQTRARAFCAIGARGVSLRRLTLPASSKDELRRLLLLQIESEFPLPPDELAWGYRPLGEKHSPPQTTAATQEVLIVAVKKEVLAEYQEVLSLCGVTPAFTLAALARARLAPQTSGSYALLDVGRSHSELASFENGLPAAVRILPWGDENITRAIEQGLGIGHDEAEKLKLQLHQGLAPEGELGLRARGAVETALDSLGRLVDGTCAAPKIYITGSGALSQDIATGLTTRLRTGAPCEPLEAVKGAGRSAAILGLKRSVEEAGGSPLLILEVKPTNGGASLTRPAPWKWAALAVLLAIASLSFPYAEAIFLKARLARKLSAIKANKGRLSTIDRELGFLQFLKQNQPPYLDVMYLLSKSAPPGTRIDSLSLNRRGDLSLRGSLRDGTQVVDFRSKLIDSGFFSTVVVDDQTPTPDRQKVNVRISAQWKSATDRESLAVGPTAAELAKPKPAGPEMPPGASPPLARPAPTPSRTPPPRPDAKE
jgi:Tfp pilus assembly PilM family ATPase